MTKVAYVCVFVCVCVCGGGMLDAITSSRLEASQKYCFSFVKQLNSMVSPNRGPRLLTFSRKKVKVKWGEYLKRIPRCVRGREG